MIVPTLRVLKKACFYWSEDNVSQMGAAIAYYTMFSVTPLLIIAIGLAGLIYGEEAAQGRIMERIESLIGQQSASAIQSMLANFRYPPSSGWMTIIGFTVLFVGALNLFTQLQASLNRIWRLDASPHTFVVRILKDYLLAFAMMLVACIFIVLLISTSTVLTLIVDRFHDVLPGDGWIWPAADFAASTILITLLFTFAFRFLSDGRLGYGSILSGAFVAAILFTFGKMAIGFYLGYIRLESAYGVAGSLVVFLVWVYYSAQIFFFGAEVTRVQANR